jgi:tryptophan-rich sensory protein
MGYSSYRVYDAGKGFSGEARIPLIFYAIQLLLNWTWSQVFFNFHLLGAASIHIVILLGFVVTTGIMFNKIDRFAGILYIPYIAWLTFASFVCFSIWRMNT